MKILSTPFLRRLGLAGLLLLAAPVFGRVHSDHNDRVSVLADSRIAADEQVKGDAVTVLADNDIEGSVAHDSVTVLGDVTINGSVGHNVVGVMGDVILGPSSSVAGDVICVGGTVRRAPGAMIAGRILNHGFAMHPYYSAHRSYHYVVSNRWAGAGLLALFLGIYALLALIAPDAIRRCGETLVRRPGATILTTLLTFLALPLFFVLLLVTIIGIPVALVVLPLGILSLAAFGKAALYALLGGRISRERLHPAAAVLVGGVVCGLFYVVPGAGVLLSLFLSVLGFGCAAATLLFRVKTPAEPSGPVPPVTPSPEVPPSQPAATAEPASLVLPPAPLPPPLAPAASRAGFWIRIGALAIDGAIFLFFAHFWILALAIYAVLMWKLKGTTLGGMVCGLKVVRLDGKAVEWDTAIIRALVCFLSAVALGLGFIWIAFDLKKQAWHDKVAGTVVVKTR